ncbi:hypothetical protein CAOG_07553 [Capsaspora owczarzaki ATCC 30864]|uniref:Ankyrin repeat protein n=1 Tax=Capsaspora owczarzaki (strain ATCC 30864) TaxID=595528 RepID=A0A0D2VZ74_CAPO3|nr:hypothetical protein CAOG_07553 [Capsaspora owczarzaki ATCC 30864]KJE97082.1 hypothetical protein CAOG_007553 [Capsaspora owczarzaki ATCC 30864]|eukprot:XP_004343427.1 hypothetical protein CAOG_07553 [Capsaspora owczarzaki ATCC 30864]
MTGQRWRDMFTIPFVSAPNLEHSLLPIHLIKLSPPTTFHFTNSTNARRFSVATMAQQIAFLDGLFANEPLVESGAPSTPQFELFDGNDGTASSLNELDWLFGDDSDEVTHNDDDDANPDDNEDADNANPDDDATPSFTHAPTVAALPNQPQPADHLQPPAKSGRSPNLDADAASSATTIPDPASPTATQLTPSSDPVEDPFGWASVEFEDMVFAESDDEESSSTAVAVPKTFKEALRSGNSEAAIEFLATGAASLKPSSSLFGACVHPLEEVAKVGSTQLLLRLIAFGCHSARAGAAPLAQAALEPIRADDRIGRREVGRFLNKVGLQSLVAWCARWGQTETVRALLRVVPFDQAVRPSTFRSRTVLQTAVVKSNLALVQVLASHSELFAHLLKIRDCEQKQPLSPLLAAVDTSNFDIVKCLVDHGADCHELCSSTTPFLAACKKGLQPMVELFIKQSGYPTIDALDPFSPRDLPHTLAIQFKHQGLIALTLKHAARLHQLEAFDALRKTALHYAVTTRDLNLVNQLLDMGVSPNVCAGPEFDAPIFLAIAQLGQPSIPAKDLKTCEQIAQALIDHPKFDGAARCKSTVETVGLVSFILMHLEAFHRRSIRDRLLARVLCHPDTNLARANATGRTAFRDIVLDAWKSAGPGTLNTADQEEEEEEGVATAVAAVSHALTLPGGIAACSIPHMVNEDLPIHAVGYYDSFTDATALALVRLLAPHTRLLHRTSSGINLLHICARQGFPKTLEFICRAAPAAELAAVIDNYGGRGLLCTPLLFAIGISSIDCVRVLLRFGANPSIPNSILDCAVRRGNAELVQFAIDWNEQQGWIFPLESALALACGHEQNMIQPEVTVARLIASSVRAFAQTADDAGAATTALELALLIQKACNTAVTARETNDSLEPDEAELINRNDSPRPFSRVLETLQACLPQEWLDPEFANLRLSSEVFGALLQHLRETFLPATPEGGSVNAEHIAVAACSDKQLDVLLFFGISNGADCIEVTPAQGLALNLRNSAELMGTIHMAVCGRPRETPDMLERVRAMVNRLLLHGASLHQVCSGSSANVLHFAVRHESAAVLKFVLSLLEHDPIGRGRLLEGRDHLDDTPFLVAAAYDSTQCLETLAELGVDVHAISSIRKMNAVCTSIGASSDASVWEWLLNRGVAVDTVVEGVCVCSSLHTLLDRNHFDSEVSRLLEHHPYLNARNRTGQTPLMATMTRSYRAISFLRHVRAHYRTAGLCYIRSLFEDDESDTPAVSTVREGVVVPLRRADCLDVNCVDGGGWTFLHHFVMSDDGEDVAKVLEYANFDVNATTQDPHCSTPLHLAAQREDTWWERTLSKWVALGFDLHARDAHGKTPAMYACKSIQSIVRFHQAGARLYDVDQNGDTLLHFMYAQKASCKDIQDAITGTYLPIGLNPHTRNKAGFNAVGSCVQFMFDVHDNNAAQMEKAHVHLKWLLSAIGCKPE